MSLCLRLLPADSPGFASQLPIPPDSMVARLEATNGLMAHQRMLRDLQELH